MFSKEAKEVNVMDEFMDGTFDNRVTKRREVWVNGSLACDIPEYLFKHLKDQKGDKIELADFYTYPDNPNN